MRDAKWKLGDRLLHRGTTVSVLRVKPRERGSLGGAQYLVQVDTGAAGGSGWVREDELEQFSATAGPCPPHKFEPPTPTPARLFLASSAFLSSGRTDVRILGQEVRVCSSCGGVFAAGERS